MKKEIIAHRKTCEANGTGLSHYILMNKKDSQSSEVATTKTQAMQIKC